MTEESKRAGTRQWVGLAVLVLPLTFPGNGNESCAMLRELRSLGRDRR
ncbi:hypothetical protein SAMN05421805_111160 [Saccharopolyspora antimicrobica]|uniref:Uncharacterized protein n=1 Tax=Saccharopolyspora antimicrobica TaxID=455193 RepID=A0A1I5FNB4_9PSEU|nr:hypothetical protein ATL45_0487 [Saccharopolyspora antimicrobica]SFO25222.1 hypothetical protein SAMN05421805_111160 [Saccharopolyspora antimicrobica]